MGLPQPIPPQSPTPTVPPLRPLPSPTQQPGNIIPFPRQPTPQPMRMPNTGLGPLVAVEAARRASSAACPLGANLRAERKRKTQDEKQTRRQRPCSGGGETSVEYRERRRRIGRFSVSSDLVLIAAVVGNLSTVVRRETKRVARKAGYNPGRGSVRIESELDSPRTWLERALASAPGPSKRCFYQVWAIERRRICRCPDGSPCRRTRRVS